jgi:hypothetical protein
MVIYPRCLAGIAGDLFVEDEQAVRKIGGMSADTLTVLYKHLAALSFRFHTARSQGCITQHFADWHSGCFQTPQKFDPDQNRSVVVPLPRLVAFDKG